MTDYTPTPPTEVQEHGAPIVMSETTKMVLMAAFAVLAAHFIQSESVMGVVLAASGAIVTWGYGVYRRIVTWGKLKRLANLLPDSLARVGKPK